MSIHTQETVKRISVPDIAGRKGGEREWYIDGYSSTVADATPVAREKLIK